MSAGKRVVVSVMVLALAGVGLTMQAATAQEQNQPRPMGKRLPEGAAERLERMTKHLNLTQDQQARIKPVLEEEEKQLKALRDQSRSVRVSTRDRIRETLTPSQQKTLDDMLADKKRHQEERAHHRHRP